MKTSLKDKRLIPNVVTARISQTLDICEKRRILTLIFGETGRGKSLTAAHWCARRANAHHIMLDSATSQSMLVRRIACELLGESRGSTEENKAAIERYLLENDTILVIDEANEMLEHPSLYAKKKCLDYIRLDIAERTGTRVALIFTTYTLEEFEHGKLSAFLEQFLGRAMNRCNIPAGVFSEAEVTPIVRAYYPDADQKLIAAAVEVAKTTGKIRSLDMYLAIMVDAVRENPQFVAGGALLFEIFENFNKGGDWSKVK